jgi:thiamine-phosphate pyrophosphorylase
MTASRTRVYLVTPPAFEPAAFASLLPAVLAAGDVAALRLRLPGAERDAVARAIAALLPVTQRADIALLLDGDAALARELGCDGVHVAAEMTAAARAIAGDALSVGAACGASFDAAIDAAEAGADYVAFGPVVGDDAVEMETVSNWASAMVVPCVVGGGLAGDNVAGWAATGAEFIALGRAIWQAEEPPDLALRRLLSSLGRSGRIG